MGLEGIVGTQRASKRVKRGKESLCFGELLGFFE